jgi:hypothetical protein
VASGRQTNSTKYWYKISVDAVRAWTTFFAILAIGFGGFWGYRLLAEHLLEREVLVAIDEADELVETLRREEGLDVYGDKYDAAREHLSKARDNYENERLRAALREAERSRTLLISISDALRHRRPAGEAQFIATQGQVEVRRGDHGEWEPARSRTTIHAGDYVKTSGNGSAEIMTADGNLVTIRPGTILLVSRSRSAFGLRSERTLALESGWVNLSTAQTASVITTPEAAARVRERSEALVTYDETEKVGRFSAYRGGIQVAAADGSSTEVGELEQVTQKEGEFSSPVSLPNAPGLLEPRDNLDLYLDSSDRVVLSWETVKGASSYALQISENRLFVDNIIDVENRSRTTATVGLKGEGAFLWRVSALDRQGQRGPWSTTYRFRVADSRESVSDSRQEPGPAQPRQDPRQGG